MPRESADNSPEVISNEEFPVGFEPSVEFGISPDDCVERCEVSCKVIVSA